MPHQPCTGARSANSLPDVPHGPNGEARVRTWRCVAGVNLALSPLWPRSYCLSQFGSGFKGTGVKDPVTPISLDVQPRPPQSVDFTMDISPAPNPPKGRGTAPPTPFRPEEIDHLSPRDRRDGRTRISSRRPGKFAPLPVAIEDDIPLLRQKQLLLFRPRMKPQHLAGECDGAVGVSERKHTQREYRQQNCSARREKHS